jgi:subtilisin family serine protease
MILTSFILALFLSFIPVNAGAAPEEQSFVPGQVIVKYKEGALTEVKEVKRVKDRRGRMVKAIVTSVKPPDSVEKTERKYGAKNLRAVFARPLDMGKAKAQKPSPAQVSLKNVYILDIDPQASVQDMVNEYKKDPNIEYAQPNYIYKVNWVPTSPLYGQQWALPRVNAPLAWDITKGDGIVVAVNDTGVDINHPDIQPNIWVNPSPDSSSGSYPNDIHGWNFVDNNNDVMDVYGHGTHCAGIVAAPGGTNTDLRKMRRGGRLQNKSFGTIGIAPEAKIMVLKGLNDEGAGYSSDLANGIVYAAQHGAHVISNSWGCSSACPSDPTTESAVSTAVGLGSVVVFAAGNASEDVADFSPANMSEVIAVAATDSNDVVADFSNTGDLIAVGAPGVDILSLKAGTGEYMKASGTSMACPLVSGISALMLAKDPSLTPAQIKDKLMDTSDSVLSGQPWGRVNAYRALTE